MLGLTDLKVGTTFVFEGDVYAVIYYEHSKVARGGAMLRTKLRNIMTGAVIEKTFKGSEKFEPANIERRSCQFLYIEGNEYYFMNNGTFEQFSLKKDDLGQSANFIKEGETLQVQFYKEKPFNILLAPKVKLKVTIAEKGLRGNTASTVTKPITVETGYVLQTPLFIKEGDTVLINTETGEYVERA